MQNYLSLVVIVVTLVGVIGSALLGFLRKSRASLIRLLLVAAAFAVAMLFCSAASDWALNYQIGGKTIVDFVKEQIPADFTDYVDLIVPVVELLAQVLLCLIIFVVLDVVSLIIYGILKLIFVRKDPETGKRKGSRLIGAIFGACHGLIFAFAFCSIFSGLVCEATKVCQLEMDGNKLINLSDMGVNTESIDYEDYEASVLGKLYCNGLGEMYFNKISSSDKIKENETVSLKGQVGALCKAVEIADQFASLKNASVDLSNPADLEDALKNIGNILGDASEEEIAVIEDMINTVGNTISDQMGVNIDLSNIDLTKFDGEAEALAIEKVASLANGATDLTQDDVNDLVDALSNSQIAMTVIDSMDMTAELDSDNKAMVENALNDSELDAATKAKIEAMFGLK